MEKARPVRNSHTATTDLLTWSEVPPPSSTNASRRHPSDGMGKVLFGGQISNEEAESLNQRKPCSGYKLKEMSGSNIFSAGAEDCESGTGSGNVTRNRTSVRIVQQGASRKSQICFSTEEKISPETHVALTQGELRETQEKISPETPVALTQGELRETQEKISPETPVALTQGELSENQEKISPETPVALTEVAKPHCELTETPQVVSKIKVKKQLSDAKKKELSGNDIFGPPTEATPPRSLPGARPLKPKQCKEDESAPRTVRTSVKVSNPAGGKSNILFGDVEEPVVTPVKKVHSQKFADLNGNDIFRGDSSPLGSSEKSLSRAKLREMSGNNIFSSSKVETKNYLGGVRKPPGGHSTIRLG